jgi:hypothetical protein
MVLNSFRLFIIDPLKEKIWKNIADLISEYRNTRNSLPGIDVIRPLVSMFLELSFNNDSIYQMYFENRLLQETDKFYSLLVKNGLNTLNNKNQVRNSCQNKILFFSPLSFCNFIDKIDT